jgi:DNA-binding PadR family transcriptional regulator
MSRLVEPVILGLLDRGEARYGYEIMEQANKAALTDSEIDAAVVYRTLRTLEEAGCVSSEWQPGQGGPHRRMYEITEVGRQHLQDWLTVLDRHGQRLLEFVHENRGE